MIKSDKPRPSNGPGANTLRGGQKIFAPAKVSVSGWLDDIGPSGYRRGFTTADFETEAQKQQLGALGKGNRNSQAYYGAALPPSVYEKPPSVSDVFAYRGKENAWKTTTSDMFDHSGKRTDREFYVPTSNFKDEELEAYRQKWTIDSSFARTVRYQTESRRSYNAALDAKFVVPSVRLLPGTPKPVELFRESLLTVYGILAFPMLKLAFASFGPILNIKEVRLAISKLDIKVSPAEFNQIVAYFTSADQIQKDSFIRTVVARTGGFDPGVPDRIFDYILASVSPSVEKAPDAVISVQDFMDATRSEEYPELVQGVQQCIPIYCDQPGLLSRNSVNAFFFDLFASSPESYSVAVKSVWTI